MRAGEAILGAMLAVAAPAGAADDSFAGAAARFFSFGDASPPALARALAAFEEGRPFATIAAARDVLETDPGGPFTDDARLLRGWVLSDLGWNDLAVPVFEALLAAEPPSPYYPLALLGLVEAHEREGRTEAVAAAWEVWFDAPWKDASGRGRNVRALLEAYGALRRGGMRPSREEADLRASPSRFAALRAAGRERVTERLLYRSGLALFRLGRHRDAVGALRRIAWTSPYHPYALYTSAQALHAAGDGAAAVAAARDLLTLPPTDPATEALAGRAAILHAQLLFESGRAEEALAAAGTIPGEGFYARQARLLRGDICLETERPSLAVTYYRELADRPLSPGLEAGRGLGLGSAYAELGDFAAASEALRDAVDRVARARDDESEREAAVRRLEGLALEEARRAANAGADERARLAAGMRRIVALEGPVTLGRIVRLIFMSHRSTILGAPVHDLEALAAGSSIRRPEPLAADPLWRDYLASAARPAVEWALARRVALEEAEGDEAAFLAADVVRAEPGRDAWRRRVVAGDATPGDVSRDAGLEAARVAARDGLRRFLRGREEELRRLEFDLQAALSDALARRAAAGGG